MHSSLKGRVAKTDQEKNEFHILDYDIDMTSFSKVVIDAGAAVGLDD